MSTCALCAVVDAVVTVDMTFAMSPRGLRRCSPTQAGSAKGDRPLAGSKRTRLATPHPLARRRTSSSSSLTPSALKSLPLISITASPSTSYKQAVNHNLYMPIPLSSRSTQSFESIECDMLDLIPGNASNCGEPTTLPAKRNLRHSIDALGRIRSPFASRLAASPPAVAPKSPSTIDSAIYAVSSTGARQTYAHDLRVCNGCGRTATNTISLASYKKCSICPGYACTFCQRVCGDGSLRLDAPQGGRYYSGNVKKGRSTYDDAGFESDLPGAGPDVSQQHCGQRMCRTCCVESGLGVPTCSRCIDAKTSPQAALHYHTATDTQLQPHSLDADADSNSTTYDAEMSMD